MQWFGLVVFRLVSFLPSYLQITAAKHRKAACCIYFSSWMVLRYHILRYITSRAGAPFFGTNALRNIGVTSVNTRTHKTCKHL